MAVPRTSPAARSTPRRTGRARARRLAALPRAAILLGAPASSGPIHLEVAGNGVSGVSTVVTWKDDGRPVTQPVALTLVAVPVLGGPRVGPVRMMPVGHSLYILQTPLPKGVWQITVKATIPVRASVTKTITLYGAPHYSPGPHDAMNGGHAHSGGAPAHSGGAESGGVSVRALIAGAAAAITLVVAALRWRTRRRTASGK